MIGNRIFNGMYPRLSARLLPPEGALLAENCWLDRGTPRAVPQLAREGTVSFGASTSTVYRYDKKGAGDTFRFFTFNSDVDLVKAPIFNNDQNRVIWSGQGNRLRQTSENIARLGGQSFAAAGTPFSRVLGLKAPDKGDRPTATLDSSFATDGSQTKVSHTFVYTWWTDLQEESPPSFPSPAVERGFDTDGNIQPVTVSVPQDFPGDRGITRFRVYRSTGGDYEYIGDGEAIQSATTPQTITDNFKEPQGDALVSELWDPPPQGLTGLVALYNGVLAAFKGQDLYFSVPYQPHAWPEDYVVTLNEDIIGLSSYGVNIVVGTRGKPYVGSGADPANVTMQQLELDQPCVHKKSFAWTDQMGICYASPDGLVLVSPRGGEFVSRDYYDREDWKELQLEEDEGNLIGAVYHDGKYVMFLRDKTVAFSPTEAPVVITDNNVRAVNLDRREDVIWFVDRNGDLYRWDTDSNSETANRMMKWRSRLHVMPGMTVNAAQVFADEPCTLILYYSMEEVEDYDDSSVTKETIAVTEGMLNRPFRIRPLGIWNHWVYEIRSQGSVQEVRIGRMNEMAG